MDEALPVLCDEDLQAMTPVKARELVCECFFKAQKETFRRSAVRINVGTNDEDLRRNVEGAVRLAFRTARADFDQPTKAMLMGVVQVLAAKAQLLGTPSDIIEHHRVQLGRIFAALPDEPAQPT